LNRPDQACPDLTKATGLGVAEAAEAMKGLCLPTANTDVENQRQFPNEKPSTPKNRLTMDGYGIYYRLN